MSSYIVNQKWHEQQKCSETEHIVVTAAKLLRAVIRESSYQMDVYPSCEDVQNCERGKEWMADLLTHFLDNLIGPDEKEVAVGHCIMQCVRPRLIAPIPFAVGISVDHICASKHLLNILHRLGLSISYDEVRRFKQSVAVCDTADHPESYPACFMQYAADNVDHDVCTLDGTGTLHAMGIISISHRDANTPNTDTCVVLRLKVMQSSAVAKVKHIPVLRCNLPPDPSAGIAFQSEFYAASPCVLSSAVNFDLLWHMGWFVSDRDELRPSWAGFNSSVHCTKPVVASDIRLLPIVDCNPNEPACVYSTLVFVAGQAQKMNNITPVITFDQPLWLKAVKIVNSTGLNVLCRLGAFHTEMSFLGSLGTLMSGSGLTDAMECCYGPHTPYGQAHHVRKSSCKSCASSLSC